MINLDYQSRTPIYLQIVQEIERYVVLDILKHDMQIPSIRELASTLGINPNTVKKAYDELESDGFVITVHGKGTYVNGNNSEYIKESRLKEVEEEIRTAFEKAENYGISKEQLREIFEMFFEE